MVSKRWAQPLQLSASTALAAAGMVLFAASITASAATPDAAAVPLADDLTCQAKNYAAHDARAQASYWPAQASAPALDSACWISAQQLAISMEDSTSKPMLIDVRPRSLQKTAPLAHALQLELTEVASKQFLKQGPIVLVGTGLDYANLTSACQQLKEQGFTKVQALQGGVRSWLAGAKVGDSFAAADQLVLQPLDANDWIVSLGQGLQWTVISISDAMHSAPKDRLPVSASQLVSVRVEGKERDAKQVAAVKRVYLEKLNSHKDTAQAQALIVVTDESVSDAMRLNVEQALAKAVKSPSNAIATLPAYWLRGGWQGYEQQVAQTAVIQQTANHKLQVPCGRI